MPGESEQKLNSTIECAAKLPYSFIDPKVDTNNMHLLSDYIDIPGRGLPKIVTLVLPSILFYTIVQIWKWRYDQAPSYIGQVTRSNKSRSILRIQLQSKPELWIDVNKLQW